VFIKAKDDGSGCDNWSYKSCKALVKSSPPTYQHPVFYRPDALPVTQPTVSEHWRENWQREFQNCLEAKVHSSSASEFQNAGPATVKARQPKVPRQHLGISRSW